MAKNLSIPVCDDLRRKVEQAAERDHRSLASWVRLQLERVTEQAQQREAA